MSKTERTSRLPSAKKLKLDTIASRKSEEVCLIPIGMKLRKAAKQGEYMCDLDVSNYTVGQQIWLKEQLEKQGIRVHVRNADEILVACWS